MKLVKQSAKFLDLVFNQKNIDAIIKAGAVCYKTENPSDRFIQKRIKAGHTSILEHGNIIMIVNDVMLKYLRALVIHSTESEYIKFSIRTKNINVVSGNCRAWYNLLLKNTVQDKKKGYSSFLCFLATKLKNLHPEIFQELFEFKKFPIVENLNKFELKFIESLDELIKPEFMIHIRLNALVVSDRGISHEWVRHRKLSYSQESTRYCNYSNGKFDSEVTFINNESFLKNKQDSITILETYKFQELSYLSLVKEGNKPQIARCVLGTGLKTEYYVSGYGYDWDEFFRLRMANDAHPQIRELANELFHQFAEIVG